MIRVGKDRDFLANEPKLLGNEMMGWATSEENGWDITILGVPFLEGEYSYMLSIFIPSCHRSRQGVVTMVRLGSSSTTFDGLFRSRDRVVYPLLIPGGIWG